MNSEIEKKPIRSSKKETALVYLKHAIQSMLHNWPWKLLAFALAILLWAGLITQDPALIREKTFQDVTVTVSGADTLQRNGLIVLNDLVVNPPTVRLKVDIPQKEYNNVTAATYNPRIDLSRIRETGTQQLRIQTTPSSVYGNVVEISPDTIEVEVDEYTSRYRVPVLVTTEGEYGGEFYADGQTVSPSTVTVSGPKSVVGNVRRCVAVFDKSTVPLQEGRFSTSIPFELVDENGNVIESDLLSVTRESVLIDSVIVDVDLFSTEKISLSGAGLTSGEPLDGYEVKRVTVSPSTIRAAGMSENLEQFSLEALFVEKPVDISGRHESFTEVIKVRKPTELEAINPDSVTVSVEIGLAIGEKSFKDVALAAADLPGDLKAVPDVKKAYVKLTGPKILLAKLTASDIALSYSVKGLTEGTHQIPIQCSIAALEGVDYTFSVEPQMVTVELRSK